MSDKHSEAVPVEASPRPQESTQPARDTTRPHRASVPDEWPTALRLTISRRLDSR